MTARTLQSETPTDAARAWADRAGAVFERVAVSLREIIALTTPLAEAASRDEPDGALALLDRRAPMVESLEALAPALRAARAEWDARSHELDGVERERVHGSLLALDALTARLRAEEDRAGAALAARRDALADEMLSVRASRTAARAYAPRSGAHPARYQDRNG